MNKSIKKMEAEEVLQLIMKKLKEYKANPMRSTFHEKARQKNLMKMFCIYTSLKKKERAKQKLKEPNKCIQESSLQQETSKSIFEATKQANSLNYSKQNEVNNVPDSEDVSFSNDLLHDKIDNSVVNSENLSNSDSVNTNSNIDIVTNFEQLEDFEETILPVASNENISNQSDKKSKKFKKDYDNEESSVDGFLMQLREGLRKLPYRQRSKLEIEFLTRLYEVEECLGLLDN